MAGQAILSDAIIGIMPKAETETVLKSGVDVVIEGIVREHARFVFRVAYSILRNHDDAEDATQEVFVRVLKYREKLADVRNHKVWLARITWRVSLDWKSARTRARESHDADPEVLLELAAVGPGAEQVLASQQLKSLLDKMIATLPPDLRDTLVLSTVQELNSSEIAEVLGIPEGSVRTRLMRARNLLKRKLAPSMEKLNA
jgi:RNA polymerase sigma-70 factor (ECF subfamily)